MFPSASLNLMHSPDLAQWAEGATAAFTLIPPYDPPSACTCSALMRAKGKLRL